ncbi:MAG: phospholipase D-like domain-containing protein, partial [Myxococcota bacterium]
MFWQMLIDFSELLVLVSLFGALWASAHVVLYKRDVRAAIGWIGFIWISPIVGPLTYLFFGVNRIQRRAWRKRKRHPRVYHPEVPSFSSNELLRVPSEHMLLELQHLSDRVSGRRLLRDNHIHPYFSGPEVYTAMCDAIRTAQKSITMVTYIFDFDRAGEMFVEAFAEAKRRGVEIKILVDDVGIRYSWPTIETPLSEHGIEVARFMRPAVPWKMPFMNLRNHRKSMVIDGALAFTGGMNIREGYLFEREHTHAILDTHFQVRGPLVGQLQEVFAEDWAFTTQEV